MSRKEVDFELKEAIKATTDIVSVKIIDMMKLLIRIKCNVEKNNLESIFFDLYLSGKPKSLVEIATDCGIDVHTLRRKRVLFFNIFKETRNEVLKVQEKFLNTISVG